MNISDLTATVDLKQCEIVATCACDAAVGGIVIKETLDPQDARRFIAGAFCNHLKAEGAWEQPAGHALLLHVEPVVEVKMTPGQAQNTP